jgi:hypothetical protein
MGCIVNELQQDESVSSWVCRQIFYARTPSSRVNVTNLRGFIRSKQHSSDLDYFYSLQDIATIQQSLPFPAPDLMSQSAAESWWALPNHRSRVNFCTQCVLDDLALSRVPVWRRNWSHWWYTLCDKHCRIMRPLTGQYRILNVVDRSAAAMKMVIDSQNKACPDNDYFAKIGLFSDSKLFHGGDLNRYSEMQLALAVFSKMASPVQAEMASFYSVHGFEAPPERVILILDLVRLLLRRHIRGIDPPAYAYQLFNVFFWRPEYQYHSGSREDVTRVFGRVEEGVDPLIRLVALAIISYLLSYPNANFLWEIIVESGARLGVLIPDSIGWLYAVISGPADTTAKNWYVQRIATYSDAGQDQCRKFATAPLCFQRITKRVSDLF